MIPIKKYATDIEKEPGRVFTREFQKNKEGMKNKIFLNLTNTHKINGAMDKDHYAPSAVTSILDSKCEFELEKDKENLRKIFGFFTRLS